MITGESEYFGGTDCTAHCVHMPVVPVLTAGGGMSVLAIFVWASSAGGQINNACHQPRVGEFSEWAKPVNLGAIVNSDAGENWPAISPNGLSLYFRL